MYTINNFLFKAQIDNINLFKVVEVNFLAQDVQFYQNNSHLCY